MKKLLLLVLFISLFLTGCFVDLGEYQDEITLTFDERLTPYLPYSDIPSYTLKFDGTLKFTNNRQGRFECIFSGNDDFKVSSIIKELINEYQEKQRISFVVVSKDTNTFETWMNRRDEVDEKVYLKVKDNTIYNEIAFITLENGLQLSLNYARFVDEFNNVYYKWQTTESIRLILHYPIMSVRINNERKFLILPLPNAVRLKFDTTTKKFDLLVSDDKFMDSSYYTYDYVNSYEEDIDDIKSYYINNFSGRIENDCFTITYLGYNFKITFNTDNFIFAYLPN